MTGGFSFLDSKPAWAHTGTLELVTIPVFEADFGDKAARWCGRRGRLQCHAATRRPYGVGVAAWPARALGTGGCGVIGWLLPAGPCFASAGHGAAAEAAARARGRRRCQVDDRRLAWARTSSIRTAGDAHGSTYFFFGTGTSFGQPSAQRANGSHRTALHARPKRPLTTPIAWTRPPSINSPLRSLAETRT